MSDYNFGVFTDDPETFNQLKDARYIDVSSQIYGVCKPSGDPKKPYTCVNGMSNTNWKYFISCMASPLNSFD